MKTEADKALAEMIRKWGDYAQGTMDLGNAVWGKQGPILRGRAEVMKEVVSDLKKMKKALKDGVPLIL